VSTYATAEAALLARIRALNSGDTFLAANSSRGDFTVLNRAGVRQACVLMMVRDSEFADNLGAGRGTHGKRQQRHYVGAVLFQARGQADDGTSYQALTALADSLIAYLDTYQRPDDTAGIKRSEVVGATVPRLSARWNAWLFQTLTIEVLTETTPTLQEGAH
jgi:hypothetical protein